MTTKSPTKPRNAIWTMILADLALPIAALRTRHLDVVAALVDRQLSAPGPCDAGPLTWACHGMSRGARVVYWRPEGMVQRMAGAIVVSPVSGSGTGVTVIPRVSLR